ncbi:MAG: hypothetical protein U5K31_03715 [Balneolaceae bacterium]|nr:hypothetical protein [Balneolaceae bacterium]
MSAGSPDKLTDQLRGRSYAPYSGRPAWALAEDGSGTLYPACG